VLCMCVQGSHKGSWRLWLQGAPAEHYSVTVHAKSPDLVHAEMFKGNCIPPIPTQWGSVSLVEAHLELLRKSLQDPQNRMFVLLSDACLPIVSFEKARCELMQAGGEWVHDKSYFHTHADKQQRDQRRYFQRFVDAHREAQADSEEEVLLLSHIIDEYAHGGPKPKPVVWAHSQWCILSRRHAEILCDSNPFEERRRKLWLSAYAKALTNDDVNKNLTLAPDELFILSYLRDYERRTGSVIKCESRTVTYGRCCLDAGSCQCGPERAKHPQSHKNLQHDFVKSCDIHMALFARKFSPGVEDGGRWVWWHRLWEAGGATLQKRMEERVKLAQLCHWEMQMRDESSRTKPSLRQQQELAAYLSNHPVPESWQLNIYQDSPARSSRGVEERSADSSDDDAPLVRIQSRHVSPCLSQRIKSDMPLSKHTPLPEAAAPARVHGPDAELSMSANSGGMVREQERRGERNWGEVPARASGKLKKRDSGDAPGTWRDDVTHRDHVVSSAKKKRKKEGVEFQSDQLAAICLEPLEVTQMPAFVRALRSVNAISDAHHVLELLSKGPAAASSSNEGAGAGPPEGGQGGRGACGKGGLCADAEARTKGAQALLKALVCEGGLMVLSDWVADADWGQDKGFALLLQRTLDALELTPFAELGNTIQERQQALGASKILPRLQDCCRRDFKDSDLNRRRKALVAKIKEETQTGSS
jgi:hypothetical protein